MSTSYQREKAFIYRGLANYLDTAMVSDFEWLTEPEDEAETRVPEATVRRRRKAAKQVLRELQKRGERA